ncbi:MAG: VTT domain-containing protein [Planctomycetes bacterium]|nr:VTT domain-containing protein [Planctomycetota bacterium]
MSSELLWYGSIFGWLFFTGIGIPPIPEEAGILYAAGLHTIHPEVRWPIAWLATGLGIISADLVLYGIGWKLGPKLFEYKWVQRILKEERRRRLEGRFHEHGLKMLILARFLPPLRTGVFLIAGAAHYSTIKFIIADLIYAVVGVGLFFLGGAWLMGLIEQLRDWAGHWAIYLVAAPILAYGLYRYYRYLRTRETKAVSDIPVSIIEGTTGMTPGGTTTTKPAGAPAAMAEAKKLLADQARPI